MLQSLGILSKIVNHVFLNDSSAEFIQRQANEVVYNLAKVALFSASSQLLVDIPHCIEHILLNEML
jgi:hypothetical protein